MPSSPRNARPSVSRGDRLANRLERMPAGARAGLLAVSIAASFALFGAGAQASPVKEAPAGPAVILDPSSGPGPYSRATGWTATFLFKSETSFEFECSLDESAYRSCASPLELTNLLPGTHRFAVRALDRAAVPGTPATRTWDIGPIPTPTPTRG